MKKNLKMRCKRSFALLLALAICLGTTPSMAFADDDLTVEISAPSENTADPDNNDDSPGENVVDPSSNADSPGENIENPGENIVDPSNNADIPSENTDDPDDEEGGLDSVDNGQENILPVTVSVAENEQESNDSTLVVDLDLSNIDKGVDNAGEDPDEGGNGTLLVGDEGNNSANEGNAHLLSVNEEGSDNSREGDIRILSADGEGSDGTDSEDTSSLPDVDKSDEDPDKDEIASDNAQSFVLSKEETDAIEDMVGNLGRSLEDQGYIKKDDGTYEKVTVFDGEPTDEERKKFEQSENGVLRTTKTETKNQQKYEPIRDEAGNIIGYDVVNSLVTTTTVVEEVKETAKNQPAKDIEAYLKDVGAEADENGIYTIVEEPMIDPETGNTTLITQKFTKTSNGKYTIETYTTVTAKEEVSDPGEHISYDIVRDGNGNIFFRLPVTENSKLHAGSIQFELVPENRTNNGADGVGNIGLKGLHVVWGWELKDLDLENLPEGYNFTLANGVVGSELLIRHKGDKIDSTQYMGDAQEAWIEVLIDRDGNKHYVYCADMDTTSKLGVQYDLENLENAGYFSNDPDTLDKLQAIATNGYWGTNDGTGSLTALKEKIQAAINAGKLSSTLDLAAVNPGAAIAGTQAAIWAITNPDAIDKEDLFNSYWCQPERGKRGYYPLGNNSTLLLCEKAANLVYQYLMTCAETPEDMEPATDLIGRTDIEDVKITVKELDDDTNGESRATYNTDVSFVLKVERDRIYSNADDPLTVKIFDPENPDVLLGSYRLVEDEIPVEGVKYAERQDKWDEELKKSVSVYILRDIVLPNGTSITLNLFGTQDVKENAYLVTAEGGRDASQTYVAVEKGEKVVDLSVDLYFSVPTPPPSTPEEPSDPEDPEDPETPPSTPDRPSRDRDRGTTSIPEGTTPLSTIPEADVPLAAIPDEEVPLAVLLDGDVPLASVPKTGDISTLWYALLALSGIGLLGMAAINAKKSKESAND